MQLLTERYKDALDFEGGLVRFLTMSGFAKSVDAMYKQQMTLG